MSNAGEPTDPPTPDYPWWVRALAVAHVLSLVVAPVAFFALVVAACAIYVRRGEVDERVIGLGLAGLACPAVAAAFRAWFERSGRRNDPPPDGPGGGSRESIPVSSLPS